MPPSALMELSHIFGKLIQMVRLIAPSWLENPALPLAPAATVSVRLNMLLKNELEIPIDKIIFWTDSMTVLRYIASTHT